MNDLKELSLSAKRQVAKNSNLINLVKKGSYLTEKKSKGDTKHTMNSLKEAAYNYAYQTKNLAKALLKSSVEKTINSNYNFCTHIFNMKQIAFYKN